MRHLLGLLVGHTWSTDTRSSSHLFKNEIAHICLMNTIGYLSREILYRLSHVSSYFVGRSQSYCYSDIIVCDKLSSNDERLDRQVINIMLLVIYLSSPLLFELKWNLAENADLQRSGVSPFIYNRSETIVHTCDVHDWRFDNRLFWSV